MILDAVASSSRRSRPGAGHRWISITRISRLHKSAAGSRDVTYEESKGTGRYWNLLVRKLGRAKPSGITPSFPSSSPLRHSIFVRPFHSSFSRGATRYSFVRIPVPFAGVQRTGRTRRNRSFKHTSANKLGKGITQIPMTSHQCLRGYPALMAR